MDASYEQDSARAIRSVAKQLSECIGVKRRARKDAAPERAVDVELTFAGWRGAVAEHASDDRFPEAAVTSTVYKYRFYLAKRKEVHELFSRWDINMDNGLDRNELRQLITQKELDRRDKREVAGMVVDLEPSEGDIDFIMEECDVNMNGVIDRAELLSALATWAMLAQQQIETRKSAMCAIL